MENNAHVFLKWIRIVIRVVIDDSKKIDFLPDDVSSFNDENKSRLTEN